MRTCNLWIAKSGSDVAGKAAPAMIGLVLCAISAWGQTPAQVATPPLQPQIVEPWWTIAGNPDLGELSGMKQQPVDFGVWQAADGTWQLWSCIRFTKETGKTRLFYRWEGARLTDGNWTPHDIAMRAKSQLGETTGGLQAPYVFSSVGRYWMFYGDWVNICSATSADGKTFERLVQPNGKTGLFNEGPGLLPNDPATIHTGGNNARDPMLIRIGGLWHCYYSACPPGSNGVNGAVYCRTSTDLKIWGESRIVARGGQAGSDPVSAECPFVVEPKPGQFYLFRTQRYGEKAQTSVYYSADPMDFGVDNDAGHFVTKLPVAAPEIIQHDGQYYIAALLPNLQGIRVALLNWVPLQPGAMSKPVKHEKGQAKSATNMVSAGEFVKIYGPGAEEMGQWHINDHCFVCDAGGVWHLFGIFIGKPLQLMNSFAHATAKTLRQTAWDKQPNVMMFIMTAPWNETVMWAPHVISYNDVYYMYYCAGDRDSTKFKIHLATSTDLVNWTRHPQNPMVVDGYHARDPFVMRDGERWLLYYTATSEPQVGNHIVACVSSTDLIHWNDRNVVFVDPSVGASAGPTESPFVVRRGKRYFLFIGPRPDYDGTDVFVSTDPLHWDFKEKVGHIVAHAAEVVRDVDGKWYISRAGIGRNGVYLAPLIWQDGEENPESNIVVPTRQPTNSM